MRLSLRGRLAIEGFAFISPWIIGFLAFIAFPIGQSFWFSLQETKLQGNMVGTTFVGLANYREALLIDVRFVPLLYQATKNLLITLPVVLTFSLIIALLLNRRIPGTGIFRAIYFLPVVFASGIVLRQLFNTGAANLPVIDQFDFMWRLLGVVDDTAVIAMQKLIQEVIRVLWGAGVQVLIFLAGLQAISPSLYEAAEVDGATNWEMFWKITLPMLSPIVLLNTIYTIVDSFTDVYNPVLGFIREVGFRTQFRLGYAAAVGWTYFALVFTILMLVIWISRKHVHYAGER